MRYLPFFLLPMFALAGLTACDAVDVDEANGPTLCLNAYIQCVDPIFHATIRMNSCSASTCHDSTSMNAAGQNFKVDPNAAINGTLNDNFNSAKNMADLLVPVNSRLLLKPLDDMGGGGLPHAGGSYFTNINDACYTEIENWINTQVGNQGDCLVPTCTVSNPSAQCG